ncbi:hypothetical protein JAO73_16860 [Hymenobacter sp. BT523]|uniref:hypothetical protein n=1 Tax=Hymenobacter sp. BT523 TaxID=2795725 RepID=UPI0018EA4DBA|nr:hypothetical protein [Hymenobacter sp. BT523]MBJ6110697.1 hypothetical protein [Hymenobacter sp. BT523]
MTPVRKTLRLVKQRRAPAIFQQHVRALLPYNQNRYLRYRHSDADSHTPWYGASFQLASEAHNISQGIDFGLPKFLDHYETFFKQLVAQFDDGSCWIVTHDIKDYSWWPNDEPTLPALRTLFAQHRVPNTFKGALQLTKPELFRYAREFLSYPTGVFGRAGALYSDVDVSHGKRPVVIKISAHLNVDFLSTDQELVRAVVKQHRTPVFTIKPYRGTSF